MIRVFIMQDFPTINNTVVFTVSREGGSSLGFYVDCCTLPCTGSRVDEARGKSNFLHEGGCTGYP